MNVAARLTVERIVYSYLCNVIQY